VERASLREERDGEGATERRVQWRGHRRERSRTGYHRRKRSRIGYHHLERSWTGLVSEEKRKINI
jgi:hypothetical protein